MDERKKAKLLIIIISIVVISLFAIASVIIIIDAKKTSTLESKVVPLSATMTIQGKDYHPNQTHKFEPGEITIVISADGYETEEISITLQDHKTSTITAALTPNNGDLSSYCAGDSDQECQLFEEIMQIQASEALIAYNKKYPVSQMLPLNVVEVDPVTYDWTEYRIDCGQIEGCKNEFCIKITDTTGGNHEKALQKIRDGGYNPNDYEIFYEYVPVVPLN